MSGLRTWTSEDDALLRNLAASGESTAAIAKREFEALRQIAAHPATRHIPSTLQSRLKDIGYANEVLGRLVLTDDGLQHIAMGK